MDHSSTSVPQFLIAETPAVAVTRTMSEDGRKGRAAKKYREQANL